jgi:hypothetical protein
VEHHAGELFPRVGFVVTKLILPSRAVVRFYNKREAQSLVLFRDSAAFSSRVPGHWLFAIKCYDAESRSLSKQPFARGATLRHARKRRLVAGKSEGENGEVIKSY